MALARLLGILAICCLATGAKSAGDSTGSTAGAGTVTVLQIQGPIGPATSHYVERGIEAAEAGGSHLIVLQIDTPGGLDAAMRDIIRAILASTVPVVSHVTPSGARAASAGTYILYASHVAAMSPATNLGAATPIAIGGGGGKPADGKPADGKTAPEPADAAARKAVNDAVAYLRGLAQLRGRNAEWAEEAVRSGASLAAADALAAKVIDLVASDLPDLLRQLDGREVKLADRSVTLATRDLVPQRVEPDWRTELLSVITNPTIAYGLLLIGIYGLLLEGYNPGTLLPGIVGVISLVLALYALQILSVNYAGLALVALGVGMIIAEFFLPSFGAVGLGGLIAFVVGSIMLFDSDVPGMDIPLHLLIGVATAGGLVIVGIAWFAQSSMRRPMVTGVQSMVGQSAEVVESFSQVGTVRCGGELWNARSSGPLQAGASVRIVRVEGLTLWVEPK